MLALICTTTIIILLIILVLLWYVLESNNYNQTERFTVNIPTLPRPFVNLYDDKGNKINVIMVSHPFTRKTGDNGSYEQYRYWSNNKGIHFIGITSYSEFPSVYSNPYDPLSNPNDHSWDHDYMKYFRIWLNCFRNPDKYIKDKTTKKLLLSESDFINQDVFKPNPSMKKQYDFLYICLEDDGNKNCKKGWNYFIRNWELAKKCISIMCNQYGLRGIIIGRENCEIPKGCEQLVTMKPKVPQNELLSIYQQTRFLLLPNIADASPRTLAEALACDMRCLVNYNILGGWKYVNKQTGEFFTNPRDFKKALDKLLSNFDSYSPSQYYRNNYGKQHSGKLLRDFLLKHLNNLNFTKESTDYITL